MKRQRHQGHFALPDDLQVIVRRQRHARKSRRDIRLEIVAVLLPAVSVLERREIEGYKVRVLGIKWRRLVDIQRAPGLIILLNQVAKNAGVLTLCRPEGDRRQGES